MKKLFATILFTSMMMILSGCSQTQPTSQSQNVDTTKKPGITAEVLPPDTAATTESSAVNIQNFAFNPATLTIKAGTFVTWTNNDSAMHVIKSDTFNSNNLSTGDSFKYKFTEKGTYDYYCAIHPSMKGQIVVE